MYESQIYLAAYVDTLDIECITDQQTPICRVLWLTFKSRGHQEAFKLFDMF